MRATEKALMARGMDSVSAARLAQDGWTLNKLKLASEAELKALGLVEGFIKALLKEQRPPIPIDNLMKVLFDNRFQCCVCRDPKQSIIVHHIDEWAHSRSHNIKNLAVLCLQHHDKAHTRSTLSQNLDAATLRGLKAGWESEVKKRDAESIYAAMRLEYSNWNYINELRVFEIANKLKIDFSSVKYFFNASAAGVIDSDGMPIPVNNDELFYMYQGAAVLQRYHYIANVFNEVVKRIPIVNVSDFLDKGVLGFALVPGEFIFVQGKHIFSPIENRHKYQGRGQICEGVRRANEVEVRFVFDRWEATSSSAQSQWLTGTRDQGSLVHVKDLSREEGRLVIRGTVLGIGSNFGDLKTREYAQSWLEWMPTRQEDDDIDDDWLDDE